MEKHVTVVAALQIGFSILGILLAIFLFFLLTFIGISVHDPEAMWILTTVGTCLGLFFLILSIPGIIGGIGLLKKKNWARILILIISAIDLFNIPIGTALAIYSIWVLVQDETVHLFLGNPPDAK
jgi:hypothetical protein